MTVHLYSYTCNVRMYMCSNKESDPEKYVLKLRLHRAGVKKCQYSRDGSKVVSCSVDCGVKVQYVFYVHVIVHVRIYIHVYVVIYIIRYNYTCTYLVQVYRYM